MRPALRTMILLDPELEPDRRPSTAPGAITAESRKTSPGERLPSARALNGFLRTSQEAVRLKGLVTVLLTTDAAIRRLNRRFRGKNKPTDVLSFPAVDVSRGEVAGDLAISVETARRQSIEQGHSLATEIKVLILHGLLHLTGFDHETDAGAMERRERALRTRLALPLGLIERSSTSASSHSGVGRAKSGPNRKKTPARGQRA
ncbi:MAG TPA: rRNA maturation RNase YbeY [Terracidiphilus sp.]|jgi:probable rRNA maturation factor|nr:rRNA maturation RNase YbeY [Terracidiphilus sp.]